MCECVRSFVRMIVMEDANENKPSQDPKKT